MNLHEKSNHHQGNSLERRKRRKERAQQLKQEREAREHALRKEEELLKEVLKLEQDALEEKIRLEQKKREKCERERQESNRRRLEKWEKEKTHYEVLIFRRLRGVISEAGSIDINEVWPNSSFTWDLGFDELDIIELYMRLEEEMDLEISDEDANGIGCLNDLLEFLVDKGLVDLATEELLDANEELYSDGFSFTKSSTIELILTFLSPSNKQEISMNNSLIKDLEMDEINVVEIVEEIENKTNINIEDKVIEKIENVRDIWCLLNWGKVW